MRLPTHFSTHRTGHTNINYIHMLQIHYSLSSIKYFSLFYFVLPLLYFINSTTDTFVNITFILLHFCRWYHLVICNFTGFINVYLDTISFVEIVSSILTQKYCNWTGKSIVQNTVSDFVPGFQWQLYVCLACVTAIAGPQHINCRKAISLVSLGGAINVLRTLVCTALNHNTCNYSRTPIKYYAYLNVMKGDWKMGPIFMCCLKFSTKFREHPPLQWAENV